MLSKFWIITSIVLGIACQSYSQIDSYSDLQKKYEFYYTKNNIDSALIYAKQMNNWALQNETDSSIRYAVSFRYIGNIFDKSRLVDSTLYYWGKSLEILKIQNRHDCLDASNCYHNFGVFYQNREDYLNSEFYFKKSLKIRKELFGNDHKIVASSLNNLGVLYHKMGEYKRAELNLKQSLDIYKKSVDINPQEIAQSFNNLGVLYKEMGKYIEAESYYKMALETYKQKIGEDHPGFAMTLQNLGNFYSDFGNYKKAEQFYKQSLEINLKVFGENHRDVASTLICLGSLYSEMGEFKLSDSLYKKSLTIYEKNYGVENTDYAMCLNNLGMLNINLGNYNSAESILKQAFDILKKTHRVKQPNYALVLDNLGTLYWYMGNYESSELYFKQAYEIRKKEFGEEHPDYLKSLNSLGILYSKIKNYKSAEFFFAKSIELNKKKDNLHNPEYMRILNNLGLLYYQMGRYNSAEQLLKQSANIKKKIFGENHYDYATGLYNLGIVKWEMGNLSDALALYKESFIIRKKNIISNFSWLSTQEKKTYLLKETQFLNELNYISCKESKVFPLSIELSFNANLISKSLLLQTSLELNKAINQSSDSELKTQFDEMMQFRIILSKMQSEGSDKKEIMDQYKFQADSLDKILVNKLGEYANAKRKFEITWKDVQANLTPSEAAIEFARYYDYADSIYKYMALVVRPEYEYPKLVKLGSESNIKRSCSQREFSDLYNYVWRGIDSLLTDVKTIYYSPVGELNNVSFSALISENNIHNQLDSSKSNWSYLMDHYELHQLTTTRYLADGTLKKNKEMPHSIKLIGGVNYTDFPILKDTINKEESNEDFALQLNLQKELNENQSKRGGKINYLKGSEIEVKDISKVLNAANWSISSSIGKNASEYQFKEELNKKSPGVLHIATHGFAFPEKEIKKNKEFPTPENTSYKISEDPMVRCGLMFSGANISWSGDSKKMIETTGDDGILTASEVANLDLSNTKLVVLSACETGLGKIESSEGTFGLKRGFKLAGVEQIIVSLWTVPDKETMELMTLFYSDLSKTKDPVISFNKAQKEMRNRYPYDPEKWAGFVLVR